MHHHLNRHHMSGQFIPTDFFETSAMIITFILMGKYLECAAKGRTSEAITKVRLRVCRLNKNAYIYASMLLLILSS